MELWNLPRESACPECGAVVQAAVFAALLQEAGGGKNEPAQADIDATCFYHPEKKAEIACEHCGRFLCALCDVDLLGEHLCPACIQAGRKKGRIRNLETHRVLYDSISLGLAAGAFFFVITSPMAMYVAIRYWNAPGSLIPRTKARFIAALLLALVPLALWSILIYLAIQARIHD